MKKLWDLKNDLSYLELEGQGWGIIMEVTRPLLLRLFYFINRPPWANILSPSVFLHKIYATIASRSNCILWKYRSMKLNDCTIFINYFIPLCHLFSIPTERLLAVVKCLATLHLVRIGGYVKKCVFFCKANK